MEEMVVVELRGPLARYATTDAASGRMEIAVDNGVTVTEILNQLTIPEHYVGLVLVNGRKGTRKSALRRGDKVVIFPVVAGG